MTTLPRVSIIVVNWNGLRHTLDCVDSLLRLDYPDFEVIVSDNGSTDGSSEALASRFPGVRVVQNGGNIGFGAAVMTAAREASGAYLAVLNNDVQAGSSWLFELVRVAMERRFAATASLLVFESDPSLVNAAGGEMSFTGMGWPRFYRQHVSAVPVEPFEVAFCAGGVTLYERGAFEEVGGFDDAFFLYVEDVDLSWKLRLAGHTCGVAPKAILRHDWDFRRNPRKMYFIEKHRRILIGKSWSRRARAILWPGFFILDAAILLGAFAQGWGKEKLEADRDARLALRAMRNRPRPVQRVREREVARIFQGGIHHPEIANPLVRFVLNPLLGAYWGLAKRCLR